MIYGILLVWLFAAPAVLACQLPLMPVYNSTAKRYLTCNSWEPDCPDEAVCQRASPEWKERLYTNPEFVLYLCCNVDGGLSIDWEGSTPPPPPPDPTASYPPPPLALFQTAPPPTVVDDPLMIDPHQKLGKDTVEAYPASNLLSNYVYGQSAPAAGADWQKSLDFTQLLAWMQSAKQFQNGQQPTLTAGAQSNPDSSKLPFFPQQQLQPSQVASPEKPPVNTPPPPPPPPAVVVDLNGNGQQENAPQPPPPSPFELTPVVVDLQQKSINNNNHHNNHNNSQIAPHKPTAHLGLPIVFPPLPEHQVPAVQPNHPVATHPVVESAVAQPAYSIHPSLPIEIPVQVSSSSSSSSSHVVEPAHPVTISSHHVHHSAHPVATEAPSTAHHGLPPHFSVFATHRPSKPNVAPVQNLSAPTSTETPVFEPQLPLHEQHIAVTHIPPMSLQQQLMLASSTMPPALLASASAAPITQNQPPYSVGPSTQLPTPPNSKSVALPPQPQVLVSGNGNRLILGPTVCLLIIGEFTQPSKDMVYTYRGTVSLIQDGGLNILVDSGSANSRNRLVAALAQQGLRPQNIQVIIYTHAHPDHMGNDNLFPYAQKFFAETVYKGDEYLTLQQLEESSMRLTQHVEIWKTPGHTKQHNSVLIRNVTSEIVNGTVAISGDLFLSDRDLDKSDLWTSTSVDKDLQRQLRYVLLCQADYIIPGHGKPFLVTDDMRSTARCSERRLMAYRYAMLKRNRKVRRPENVGHH